MINFFRKKNKYRTIKSKKDIPAGLWLKCPGCAQAIFSKSLEDNLKVCPKCDWHFTLGVYERVKMLLDEDSFQERDKEMTSDDPLEFRQPVSYEDKLKKEKEKTQLNSAAIYGEAVLGGCPIVFAATDSRFFMGSMGSVVGEKITRAVELAVELRRPLVIVSGSGGGARMQEGMFSLMQMAKTSLALGKFKALPFPYIAVLTHPTMAGVLASFAGLGDITIAEKGALIGFTGPRVIEQTIRQKLPEGFQRAEFSLQHGLVDMVLHRRDLRPQLVKILSYFK